MYQLRKRQKLIFPRRRTEKEKRSLAFRGPLIWNAIDKKSKDQGYEVFKRNIGNKKDTIDIINFRTGTVANFNEGEQFLYLLSLYISKNWTILSSKFPSIVKLL